MFPNASCFTQCGGSEATLFDSSFGSCYSFSFGSGLRADLDPTKFSLQLVFMSINMLLLTKFTTKTVQWIRHFYFGSGSEFPVYYRSGFDFSDHFVSWSYFSRHFRSGFRSESFSVSKYFFLFKKNAYFFRKFEVFKENNFLEISVTPPLASPLLPSPELNYTKTKQGIDLIFVQNWTPGSGIPSADQISDVK